MPETYGTPQVTQSKLGLLAKPKVVNVILTLQELYSLMDLENVNSHNLFPQKISSVLETEAWSQLMLLSEVSKPLRKGSQGYKVIAIVPETDGQLKQIIFSSSGMRENKKKCKDNMPEKPDFKECK